jgi:hypothetical protein
VPRAGHAGAAVDRLTAGVTEDKMLGKKKSGSGRKTERTRAGLKGRQKKQAPRRDNSKLEDIDYSTREAAEKYTAAGLPVFPLHERCTCTDRDCTQPGKHPRVKEATTNRKLVKQYWSKWPNAKIGVPLGSKSGLLALIIDGAAGRKSLKQLEDKQK